MKTHEIYDDGDHIAIIGNGRYFSWIAEINEDNKFELSTIYGSRQGEFSTFRQLLDHIEYDDNYKPIY